MREASILAAPDCEADSEAAPQPKDRCNPEVGLERFRKVPERPKLGACVSSTRPPITTLDEMLAYSDVRRRNCGSA